jgi:hypothetical protein
MKHLRALTLMLGVAALLVSVARPAAVWTTPADLSGDGQSADNHQLAIDSDGTRSPSGAASTAATTG